MPKKKKMKNRKKSLVLFWISICFLMTGCGEKQEMYLQTATIQEQETETLQEEDTEAQSKERQDCYVYVCGAVATPGVYKLRSGSRIYEAVELAGGFLDTAAPESLNQALEVSDGQMIQVLTIDEMKQTAHACGNSTDGDGNTAAQDTGSDDGKVDLNAATAAELMTLPGIGETKAEAILSYRREHGSFANIEDIKKITGIKDGVYEKIKDGITVN